MLATIPRSARLVTPCAVTPQGTIAVVGPSTTNSLLVPVQLSFSADTGDAQQGMGATPTAGNTVRKAYEQRTALDEVAQMMGGLAYMTGPVGRPLRAGASIVDIGAATYGVVGILAALYRRGKVKYQDVMDRTTDTRDLERLVRGG